MDQTLRAPRVLRDERETYEHAFAVDAYSAYSPGEKYVPAFLDMAALPTDGVFRGSLLDAGCGTGKGAAALVEAGFAPITLCDFVDERIPEVRAAVTLRFTQVDTLWRPLYLGWFDYVYCTDVLEHIPPEFTMLVIARLLEVARRGLFLSIALVPDGFGVWVGKPLHQTVRGFTWWRDNIETIGHIVECRDLLHTGLYYVRPIEGTR